METNKNKPKTTNVEDKNRFTKVSKLWEAVEKYSGGKIIDMRAVMK